MSGAKKIRSVFNRVASHGASAVLALALSIGTGIGLNNSLEYTHETAPPAVDMLMLNRAETSLRNMSAEILREQEKLDFTANSIAKAQGNLGTSTGSVGAQIKELGEARAQHGRDTETQLQRLADFRRELWFNPAMSEAQADKIYTDLFYAAQERNLSTINNFLAPMTDALTFRDETIRHEKLPMDAAKVDNATVARVVATARASDERNDTKQWQNGLFAGAFTGVVGAALIGTALVGRRRDEEQAEEDEKRRDLQRRVDEAAAREAARQAAHPKEHPPEHDGAWVSEEPAPAKKAATGGKFTV